MTQFIEQIDKETALAIHSAAIARFGGLDGVNDDANRGTTSCSLP